MGTEIQINLLNNNTEYASNFDQGHLALPPAKKYAVGKSQYHMLSYSTLSRSLSYPLTADPFQSPAWTLESTQQQPME